MLEHRLVLFTEFIKSVPFCKVSIIGNVYIAPHFLSDYFWFSSQNMFWISRWKYFNVSVQELESYFYNTVQSTIAVLGCSKLNLTDPEFIKLSCYCYCSCSPLWTISSKRFCSIHKELSFGEIWHTHFFKLYPSTFIKFSLEFLYIVYYKNVL